MALLGTKIFVDTVMIKYRAPIQYEDAILPV